MKKNSLNNILIETYPDNYHGYEFISLIRVKDKNYVNIIDNVTNKKIICYVLDLCKTYEINENEIIEMAAQWFNSKANYPISVEFSKNNLSEKTSKILKIFPLEIVSRIIGPVYSYDLSGPIKMKRRKKKDIPPNVEFINKTTKVFS